MRLALLVLLCLSISMAFGQTIVTNTVMPVGGDYTSLNAWEAGEQADLTAANEISLALIDGDWSGGPDTTAVTIDGWTTDATRYIEVRTSAAARHAGKWDTTKYIMDITSNNSINILEQYVNIYGIQIKLTRSSADLACVVFNAASGVYTLGSCILRGVLSGTAASRGVFGQQSTAQVNVRNCAIYDFINGASGHGILVNSTTTVDNCTIYNCGVGYARNSANSVTARNTIANACVDGFSLITAAGSTNNCSDISSDAPGTNPVTGTVTFVDAANGDFHLAVGDTVAKDSGIDLSTDFTTDIDGQTRTGTWDIGADEYIVSGTSVFWLRPMIILH